MVHGHHGVILLALHLGEDRVGGDGAFHIPSLASGFFDGRGDFVFLLVPEETVFPGMGIQAGDPDAGVFDPQLFQDFISQANDRQDPVLFDPVAGLSHGGVSGHVGNAEMPVSQKHGVFFGVGQMGQEFGVAGIVETGFIDGFFVDGRGHDGLHPSFHGQSYGFLNILDRRLSGHGIDLAVFQPGDVDILQIQHGNRFRVVLGLFNLRDGLNLQVALGNGKSLLHGLAVPDDDGQNLAAQIFPFQGFDNDLRADAGGISHGNSDGHLSFCRFHFLLANTE